MSPQSISGFWTGTDHGMGLDMKLTVDPWHWLDKNGNLPLEPARLRRLALRVARIIEYGGPIAPRHALETLIDCPRRPRGKQCPGLMWVEKFNAKTIVARCIVCNDEEIIVRNWEDTEWANGPMEPVPVAHVRPTDHELIRTPSPKSPGPSLGLRTRKPVSSWVGCIETRAPLVFVEGCWGGEAQRAWLNCYRPSAGRFVPARMCPASAARRRSASISDPRYLANLHRDSSAQATEFP